MKSFIIHVPIYEVYVKVVFGDTSIPKDHLAEVIGTSEGCYLMRFRISAKSPDFKNTLAHEMFHLVFKILDRAGMKLTNESQEAFAYLQGYLVEQIYKRCK
jgi:hypothetical protein